MACETMRRPQQTPEERRAEVKAAIKALEEKLSSGAVKVTISPQGAIAFAGWSAADRKDLSDACTYRTLATQGSWALRQAVARAEAMSGRKVNAQVIAAGVHSHDGGKTWGRH